jgi:hypothetical protein
LIRSRTRLPMADMKKVIVAVCAAVSSFKSPSTPSPPPPPPPHAGRLPGRIERHEAKRHVRGNDQQAAPQHPPQLARAAIAQAPIHDDRRRLCELAPF